MIKFDAITIAASVGGCKDINSPNYNPDATFDDGSCVEVSFRECIDKYILNISLSNCTSKESKKALKAYAMYQSLLASLKEKNTVKIEMYKEKLADLCNCKTC